MSKMKSNLHNSIKFIPKVAGIMILASLVLPNIFDITNHVKATSTQEAERAKLEAEYNALLKEIAEWENTLSTQKKESGSITGEINVLTSKIEKAKAEVKAKTIAINNISKDISQKNSTIVSLEEEIRREESSIAELLRKTNEYKDTTILHIILGDESLSEYYSDNDSYASIRVALKDSLDNLQNVKSKTEIEKKSLQEKQNAELDAKYELEQSKKQIELSESEKQKLLSISKNKESEYQKILSERQARAAQLRAALFSLRDTAAIPFGDALDYANLASKTTGVRPALVLAILEQESAYGANIGSCYLKDPVTGSGVGKNTGTPFANVMKPTRDVTPFLDITAKTGRDPYNTPVSCPIGGVGYGGAMGPSQFIPSTWKIFENRIAASVGAAVADPWIPYHAITATSMYLQDLGAGAQTYTAERNAACRYYSGRVCDTKSPPNTFYGNQVMAKAAAIQANIDIIEGI